jgi:hypothetical protein
MSGPSKITHDKSKILFISKMFTEIQGFSHSYFSFPIILLGLSLGVCACGFHATQQASSSTSKEKKVEDSLDKDSLDKDNLDKDSLDTKKQVLKNNPTSDKIDSKGGQVKKSPMTVQATFRQGSGKADSFLTQFFDLTLKAKGKSRTLKRAQKALKTVLEHPDTYRFQLIVTEVDLKTGELIPHEYRVDHEYLYPASAIKTFASLASLMYFTELSQKNPWISIDNPLGFHAKKCVQTDSSNVQGKHVTLLHEIRKTQLVSSNKAFNRVFKVVGSETLHDFLLPHFPSLRVYHRLSTNETHQESLRVPPIKICKSSQNQKKKKKKKKSKVLRKKWITLHDKNAPNDPSVDDTYTGFGKNKVSMQQVGQAYIDFKTKKMMSKPMDFSWKNRVSLYDFQLLTAGIYQPKKIYTLFGRSFSLQHLPTIKTKWLHQLRKAMVLYPRHSKNPKYESTRLSETRFKPLMRGLRLSDSKTKPSGEGKGLLADQNIYYLNKAGKALGFHVDNAFIAIGHRKLKLDKKSFQPKKGQVKSALYVTVGLYVNKDQVLNNNKYEYTRISVPILDAIGYATGLYLQNPARIKKSENPSQAKKTKDTQHIKTIDKKTTKK